ncbi:MAG: histidinol-phosphate transaminase [Elusimicrobia bacterium]|nr:histidinol-phosphate transaminase [Elusimicrobiota bacterium]
MSQPTSPIRPRPELEHFEIYKPGLAIQQIKRQFGLKEVVKLASNECALGASPKAASAYKKLAKDLYRYPESRSVDLRRALAERHKRDLGEVIVGAGSDEIIELLAKAYLTPQDEVIVSASAFLQYRIAAHLMGARVVTVPLKNWKHDLDGMAAAVTGRTKLIFIANPNNPTGTYNTETEVNRFLAALPERVLPVFDEAYFEFASTNADYPDMVSEFKRRPMVVLRTFSKIYGLAGLRVGWGVAPEAVVSELDKIRPPFNVSLPAQAAALAAMQDTKHVKKAVELNEKERAAMRAALEKMGFEVIPSAANFLLFRVEPRTGFEIFERLLRKGIIARVVDEYALPAFLRVTIGLPKENKKFLEALREVISQP